MPDINLSYVDPQDQQLLPARRVWERYGIADRTLDRWLARDLLSFPKPFVVNGRRYWREAELVAWERSRALPRSENPGYPDSEVRS